jgi:hypothetical protein
MGIDYTDDAMQGISLSVEQYQALVGMIPSINEELRRMGLSITDPDSAVSSSTATSSKSPKKNKKKSEKENFDATSDEDGV